MTAGPLDAPSVATGRPRDRFAVQCVVVPLLVHGSTLTTLTGPPTENPPDAGTFDPARSAATRTLPRGWISAESSLLEQARAQVLGLLEAPCAAPLQVLPLGPALRQRTGPRSDRVLTLTFAVLGVVTDSASFGDALLPLTQATASLPASDQAFLVEARQRAQAHLAHGAAAIALLQSEFTLGALRRIYEPHWGAPLNPSNFACKALRIPGLVQETGRVEGAPGKPAVLYRRGPGPSSRLAPEPPPR